MDGESGRMVSRRRGSAYVLLKEVQDGAQGKRCPTLTKRPVGVVIAWIRFSAALPTRLMFAQTWRLLLKRIRHVYGDDHWGRYFAKVYMHRALVKGFMMPCARWHYGMHSLLLQGHPPSQQPIEQQHSALKRMLKESLRKTASLVDLCKEWRAQIATWCGPAEDAEGRV